MLRVDAADWDRDDEETEEENDPWRDAAAFAVVRTEVSTGREPG